MVFRAKSFLLRTLFLILGIYCSYYPFRWLRRYDRIFCASIFEYLKQNLSAVEFKTYFCSLIHLVQFPNIHHDTYHSWLLWQLVYICNLHLVYGHIDFPPLHQFCHMCSLQLNYKITFNTIITLQIFTGLYRVPVGFFCNIYGKGL